MLVSLAGPVVDQGDLDLTRADRAQSFVPLGLPEQQGQPRVRPQAAGQRGREGRRGGGEGGDRDPAGRLALLRGQVGFGLFDLGQDALSMSGEPDARVSELGGPRCPVEQDHACLTFQGGQLLGHGGGRIAQGRRGRRDRPPAREFLQQAQPVQIQHKFNLPSTTDIDACPNAQVQACWSERSEVHARPDRS